MTVVEPVTENPPHRVPVPVTNQVWRDVVFLHWPCAPEEVLPHVPDGTQPDTFDGSAWIGVVALRMPSVRVLGLPVVPPLRELVELNVRTYCIDRRGRRGLVFLTMEASSPAVLAASALGGLPYRWARASCAASGHELGFRSQRSGTAMDFRVRVGKPVEPTPLNEFLTARWHLLFTWYGLTLHLPVEHEPWRLHSAELLDFTHSGLPGPTPARRITSVLWASGVNSRFGLPTPA
ncbi:DUF2071 domain-containing protein [Saccharopolyspora sp. NPDC049426]|uniref:YqjF family protein n=1 Tax=Saccharopolyspora sp. NPDC049426 TaxID=3155652 RepID=UPI0034365070